MNEAFLEMMMNERQTSPLRAGRRTV